MSGERGPSFVQQQFYLWWWWWYVIKWQSLLSSTAETGQQNPSLFGQYCGDHHHHHHHHHHNTHRERHFLFVLLLLRLSIEHSLACSLLQCKLNWIKLKKIKLTNWWLVLVLVQCCSAVLVTHFAVSFALYFPLFQAWPQSCCCASTSSTSSASRKLPASTEVSEGGWEWQQSSSKHPAPREKTHTLAHSLTHSKSNKKINFSNEMWQRGKDRERRKRHGPAAVVVVGFPTLTAAQQMNCQLLKNVQCGRRKGERESGGSKWKWVITNSVHGLKCWWWWWRRPKSGGKHGQNNHQLHQQLQPQSAIFCGSGRQLTIYLTAATKL